MSRRWKVVLSSDAARALEGLPGPARRPVAAQLDALAGGLPAAAEARSDGSGAVRIEGANHELTVLPREADGVMLVVGISTPGSGETASLAGALPWGRSRGSEVVGWIGDAAQDVRYAVQAFRRSPGFTLAVLLTLALGIGGTTAIFQTLHAVYGSALPFERGDRLLRLRSYTLSGSGGERVYNMPPRDALLLREESRTLAGVVAQRGYDLTLVGEGLPRRARGVRVSPGWADLLGVEPIRGRVFTPDEEQAGGDAGVALISHSLWQEWFGGDPAAVGSVLPAEAGPLEVVGILPPRFRYPYDAEVWTPFRLDRSNYTGHDLNVVGRMADGATLDAVRAETARIYTSLAATSPGTAVDDGVRVATLRDDIIREDGRIVQALLVAVAFLLLLACVNVANLLTAHFLGRGRELGVRAALGAGRARQLRQLLTETLLLFLVGGLAGLGVAWWMGDALAILVPGDLSRELGIDASVGPSVAAFALGTALVGGLIFGGAAALRASRADLTGLIREGGRGSSRRGSGVQNALVVAELALSLTLLVAAGVMFAHFQELRAADTGYDLEELYTFRLPLQQDRYDDAEARSAFVRRLETRLAAEPEVAAAGVTSVNPLCCGDWGAPIAVEGLERSSDDPPILIHHRYVTPAFFEAMEIELLRGSLFSDGEGPGSAPTVVVDDALARRFWPGRDPVGRRLRIDRDGYAWRTVIGVVETVEREGDYGEAWYLPFHQDPLGRSNEDLHVMVRVRGEGGVDAARRAVAELDPNLPTYGVAAMADLRAELLAQDRLGSVVSMAFAGFGLLLATFGLYGLLAYVVGLRSREIGTRIALGASRGEVLWMVLRRAGSLLGVGTAVGLATALALNLVLRRLVLGVDLAGPGLLLPVVGVLLGVAGLAALVPAVRAARVDPVTVLQGE